MIANLTAAAELLRANADLLGRNGYSVANLTATMIRMANRAEYNGAEVAIRSVAYGLMDAAKGVDIANGVRTFGNPYNGITVSMPIGAETADANALTMLASDLIGAAA